MLQLIDKRQWRSPPWISRSCHGRRRAALFRPHGPDDYKAGEGRAARDQDASAGMRHARTMALPLGAVGSAVPAVEQTPAGQPGAPVRGVFALAGCGPARDWICSQYPEARRRPGSRGAHSCLARRRGHWPAHPAARSGSNDAGGGPAERRLVFNPPAGATDDCRRAALAGRDRTGSASVAPAARAPDRSP